MFQYIDNLLFGEYFPVVAEFFDKRFKFGQRPLAVGMVEYFEPDEVDGVLDQIECGRVGRHQVKAHLYFHVLRQGGEGVLHLTQVRRAAVEEDFQSIVALGLAVGRQVGQVVGHLRGLGRLAGPEVALAAE